MTTSNPEIDQKLLNLYFLRDVVIPYMRKPGTLVNFNYWKMTTPSWGKECGTYRCLLGWYHFLRYGSDIDEYAVPWIIEENFPEDMPNLFGSELHGNLDSRENKLRVFIAIYERRTGIGDVEK